MTPKAAVTVELNTVFKDLRTGQPIMRPDKEPQTLRDCLSEASMIDLPTDPNNPHIAREKLARMKFWHKLDHIDPSAEPLLEIPNERAQILAEQVSIMFTTVLAAQICELLLPSE